jgi:hypothetical protein
VTCAMASLSESTLLLPVDRSQILNLTHRVDLKPSPGIGIRQ